jgi:CheY-like chemotaxis protein
MNVTRRRFEVMKATDVSPRSRSVLLVDDDQDISDAMTELLRDAGYECVQARTGVEALAIMEFERPALLLVDLVMPTMDGIDLLALLRENPSYRDIPVIVMTAASERMVGGHLDVPVLQKPIDLAELSRMLALYCPHCSNPAEAPAGA